MSDWLVYFDLCGMYCCDILGSTSRLCSSEMIIFARHTHKWWANLALLNWRPSWTKHYMYFWCVGLLLQEDSLLISSEDGDDQSLECDIEVIHDIYIRAKSNCKFTDLTFMPCNEKVTYCEKWGISSKLLLCIVFQLHVVLSSSVCSSIWNSKLQYGEWRVTRLHL